MVGVGVKGGVGEVGRVGYGVWGRAVLPTNNPLIVLISGPFDDST